MTLEQRVEALEMAIANMVAQQSNAEDISEIAAEVIANASKPVGVLNAAQKQTAYKINLGVNRGKSV
ncbi:hypothetical protein EYY98_19965 [Obesumbacterium proteus]|nr:hypothetical protein EYY98_19965 [Obesumbacterium proteus]